jgi:outer membrane protein
MSSYKTSVIKIIFFAYICRQSKILNQLIQKQKMKRFFLIAFTITTLFCSNTFAQMPKFGHINSAELIQLMPGLKDAETKLETYSKSMDDQFKNMQDELQKLQADYQAKEKLMTDIAKEVKQKEMQQKYQNFQQFQQEAQEKIAAKKEELYSPILKKAETAIKDVAKKNGYAYVFDTSVGSFLYAQDSDNMMELVKKELGIVTPAIMPGTVAPTIQTLPKH